MAKRSQNLEPIRSLNPRFQCQEAGSRVQTAKPPAPNEPIYEAVCVKPPVQEWKDCVSDNASEPRARARGPPHRRSTGLAAGVSDRPRPTGAADSVTDPVSQFRSGGLLPAMRRCYVERCVGRDRIFVRSGRILVRVSLS